MIDSNRCVNVPYSNKCSFAPFIPPTNYPLEKLQVNPSWRQSLLLKCSALMHHPLYLYINIDAAVSNAAALLRNLRGI